MLWQTMIFTIATSKSFILPDKGDQENVGQLFSEHRINNFFCAKNLFKRKYRKPKNISGSMSVTDHSISLKHPKSIKTSVCFYILPTCVPCFLKSVTICNVDFCSRTVTNLCVCLCIYRYS